MKFKTIEEKDQFRKIMDELNSKWTCYCTAFCHYADVCDKSLDCCLDYHSSVAEEDELL